MSNSNYSNAQPGVKLSDLDPAQVATQRAAGPSTVTIDPKQKNTATDDSEKLGATSGKQIDGADWPSTV